MRKIEVVEPDVMAMQTQYGAPRCRVRGSLECRSASPPGASIWMLTADLEAGASFAWEDRHGDEALFVQRGELEVDGRAVPQGGALIIEANACPAVKTKVSSRIVHMGPCDDTPPAEGLYGPAKRDCPGVHLVGPSGTFETREDGRETRFFGDATCPGCRLWLLYTSRSFAWETPIHSHSQDELIHLLQGEIQLGSLRLQRGATVFIAAHQPYHFRSGDEGFALINYRRDASEMTIRPTGERILEAGEATGMTRVNDLR